MVNIPVRKSNSLECILHHTPIQGEGMRNTKGPWIIVLVICGLLAAGTSSATADSIRLDWAVDGPLLGGGVALAGIGELLLPKLPPPWGPLGAPDISQVNPFDRSIMFSYSHPLDLASTILEYSMAGLPLAFALIVDSGDILPLGVVYVESISLALAAKNLLNYLIPRYRPYMYEGGAPGVDSSENDLSFPSGHSTIVFAAATAGVTLFAIYSPGSPYFLPFAIASYTLATATASLRVLCGMHFATDVIIGAALGAAFGYIVPTLHARASSRQAGLHINATMDRLSLSYVY
jgi:membrane-associated phospholipid phosphatase